MLTVAAMALSAGAADLKFDAVPVWAEGRTAERNLPLDFCEGVVPVTDREEIRVSWKKSGGDVKVESRVPDGWIVRQIGGTK